MIEFREGERVEVYDDEATVAIFNAMFRSRGMAHRLVFENGKVVHKDLTPEEIEQERKELEKITCR